MQKSYLVRWLIRKVPGADRVELIHKGADEADRVVGSYDLGKCDADRIEEIAAEILAEAQEETNLLEVRASFVIRCAADEDRTIASTRLRCQPDQGLPEGAEDEPSRDGLLQMSMFQMRFMFKEVCAAPQKQRLIYEGLIELLQKELQALRAECTALRGMVRSELGDDIVASAELVKDAERRSDMLDKALGEGLEIAKFLAAKAAGFNVGVETPGSANGIGGQQ